MKKLFLVLTLLSGFQCFGQQWSGILAQSRAVDWSNSGIPGGIPSATWADCVTTACNTLYSGTVTAASINSALASAPNNTVVKIPAGTYTLSASVHSNRSNVVLRGAGPTKTKIILNGYNILMGLGSGGQGSTPGGLGTTSLSTLTKGSTVLTVGSTSGLSAGQVVQIDQRNDAFVNVNGNEGAENAGRCESPLSFSGCNNRAQLELVQIHSVNSSTQITIEAPGLSHSYNSGLAPQVFYWSSVPSYNGVENLSVDAGTTTTSDFAVSFPFCNYCWAKNVSVVNGHRAAIYAMWSYRPEVRDSYVSESNTAGAPTEYGIEFDSTTLGKIENNILFGVTTPVINETSYGTVVGYNYMLNTSSGNQFPNQDTHRAHDFMHLYEGNVVGTLAWDFIWGSGSHNTAFRNRFSGNDPNKTNYRLPAAISAYNRYANMVGNVLGDPTFHSTYQCTSSNLQTSNNFIYDIGFYNRCELGTSNYDTTTLTSLMRWGNWDAVTYKANGNSNGVRWCTGSGSGNSACTASETANTDATAPGLASPSTSLPASFYLASKPSWWGNVAWPAIGPDVSNGDIANSGGHAYKIPSQVCYESTTKNSGGFLTAFDASSCYSTSTASTGDTVPKNVLTTVQ